MESTTRRGAFSQILPHNRSGADGRSVLAYPKPEGDAEFRSECARSTIIHRAKGGWPMSSYPKTKSEKTKSLLHALALLCAIMVGFLLLFKMTGWKPPNPHISPFTTQGDSPGEFTHRLSRLTTFYNAGLKTNWLEGNKVSRKDLSRLPQGTNSFSGVAFRVQDVVQLRGSKLQKYASSYTDKVEGIPVNMKCARIHFLHGTAWSAKEGARNRCLISFTSPTAATWEDPSSTGRTCAIGLSMSRMCIRLMAQPGVQKRAGSSEFIKVPGRIRKQWSR